MVRNKRNERSRRHSGLGDNAADQNAEREGIVGQDPELSAQVIAAVLGITDRRLQQLVQEGMPRIGHGLYPLGGCVRWYVKYWEDRAKSRDGDTRKQEKQDLENAILRAKYEEAHGHTISRVEVVQVVSAGAIRLGKMLDALPTSVGRELNMSSDGIRLMRARIDEAREGFIRDCKEFIDVVEEPPRASRKQKRV